MGGSLKKCLNAGSIIVVGGDAYTGQICGYVAANVNNINGAINGCYGKSCSSLPLIGWYGSGSQTQPELTDSSDITSIQAVNTPSTCLVGEQLYWWCRVIDSIII